MKNTLPPADFSSFFRSLTGQSPLTWQDRLFAQFAKGDFPAVIDLPTGLGKTMVMAIWMIARANNLKLPARLIYVVDRRTVVDQATYLAVKLARNWKIHQPGIAPPAISTLRGQLADNRQWLRDPSSSAIVIGTVDLIGSALLFSGYRSSFKRRPLEAGMLGQDSLLVLDEAHLSTPFEKLLGAISNPGTNRRSYQTTRDGQAQGRPMRVICMSATSGELRDTGEPFKLQLDETGSLTSEDAKDATIVERFLAKKTLRIVTADKPLEALVLQAHKLATEKPGSRIVIFVRTPKQVIDIREALVSKNKEYLARIALLTGTMRGLERDELVTPPTAENQHERQVMQLFLNADNVSSQPGCFLISTSAGEVGFDLNADHLIGDEAPLDSWIQRLGRVNRRGKGDAAVVLVKASVAADKTDFERACTTTTQLFTQHLNGKDVSPQALATFRKSLTHDKNIQASSPRPTLVDLSDILLDAWSLTSITERMPGRPEVGPWLRGIDDEQSQTAVAWRAELQLFPSNKEQKDSSAQEQTLQSLFAMHPLRPHELLTVNTGQLLEFLKKLPKLRDRPHDLMETIAAVRLPRGNVVCRTLQQLVDDPSLLFADSTLILPAALGGLNRSGMLDTESIQPKPAEKVSHPSTLDIADQPGYEQTDSVRSRLRILLERNDEGDWTIQPLPGQSLPSDIKLLGHYEKTTQLFADLRTAKLHVRLVQELKCNVEEDAEKLLVMLSPATKANKNEDQSLDGHVGEVVYHAERIASGLGLAEDDPIRIALIFAAKWHDEGKKAEIWQTFACGPMNDRSPKGKTVRSRNPQFLRGYRHEFGSLLRIQIPERCETADCNLPQDPEARELALHLIATHHGAGRPHFRPAIYDPFTDTERDDLHTQSIQRFARLQKKYGWWQLAWLENLLRCADASASADEESTSIDETEGTAT